MMDTSLVDCPRKLAAILGTMIVLVAGLMAIGDLGGTDAALPEEPDIEVVDVYVGPDAWIAGEKYAIDVSKAVKGAVPSLSVMTGCIDTSGLPSWMTFVDHSHGGLIVPFDCEILAEPEQCDDSSYSMTLSYDDLTINIVIGGSFDRNGGLL